MVSKKHSQDKNHSEISLRVNDDILLEVYDIVLNCNFLVFGVVFYAESLLHAIVLYSCSIASPAPY